MQSSNKRYSLGLYEKAMPSSLSVIEKLEITQRYGYDFMELSIDEDPCRIQRLKMSKSDKIALISHCLEHKIKIDTLCLSANRKYPLGHFDATIAQAGLTMIKEAIDLCSDLGIRLILVSGYDIFYGESNYDTKERFKENLAQAVHHAAKKSVYLAIETMDTDFINTCYKAKYYCDLFGSPYLGVYLDIGNATNAAMLHGINLEDDIRVAKDKIMCVHFKDVKVNQVRNVDYGDGIVDFEKTIRLLSQLNIVKYVSEFWNQSADRWEAEIETSKRFADRYLSKYYR